MGHALNKILKDIVNRYKLLRGHRVQFIPGWDCHGLPIEHKALEKLPESARRDMLRPESVLALRAHARAFAEDAIKGQMAEFRRWGVMADWNARYLTMDPRYEAAQLDAFLAMWEHGVITRGSMPVHWSPSSRTALAEAELEYVDDHVSQAVLVGLALQRSNTPAIRDEEVKRTHEALNAAQGAAKLLIWTTTPWTLPANVAVSFNPSHEYVLCAIQTEGGATEHYVMGAKRVPYVESLLKCKVQPVLSFPGHHLSGLSYNHPFIDRVSPMLPGDHVVVDSGSGLVHTAPGHGVEDFELCKAYNHHLSSSGSAAAPLPILCPVDELGRFTPAAEHGLRSHLIPSTSSSGAAKVLAGRAVLGEGNNAAIELLRAAGCLVHQAPYKHRYPYDWRTKKPVIFRATEQWFATLDSVRPLGMAAFALQRKRVYIVYDLCVT